MALDSNFNIQLSAIVNAQKLRQSVESALKKEFSIKVKAQTSGGVVSGDSSIISSSGTKVSGMSATEKQLTRASRAVDNFNTKLINLKTTGGLTDTEFKNFSEQLNSVNSEFQKTKNLDNFTDGMHKLKNSVSQASTANKAMGQSLTDIIGKFTKWYLIAGGVTSVINGIKQIVSNVISLDASMVELQKVTDLTSEGLDDVKQKAFDLAEGLGQTGQNVIDATTEFARMGYTVDESLELAEVAVMMTNIAEGITDAGDAANILTSILKGTNTEIKYANSLLDRLNEISNNNAVSFSALARMTQEAAATMDILGNNLDQTMGLLTGAFSVLQDESVANGIQTIGLRIAGLNEDMESVAGLSNQVVEALQKYAGIEAFDEQTGQLKNTYTILQELAGVWETIDKNKQSALLNTLAGKRQADVAASILKNWEGVEKAVLDAQNSMGSAIKENERAIDSIQGHINAFKNAFQDLSDTILSSELVKGVIDIGTGLLKVLDRVVEFTNKIGGANTVLSVFAGIIAAINAKQIVGFVTRIVTMIGKLGTYIATAWSATTANVALSTSMGNFGMAAAVGVAVAAITGLTTNLLSSSGAAEVAKNDYDDLADSFEKNKNVISEFDSMIRKLKESMKGQVSIISERLEQIKEENEDLERQRTLQEKLQKVEEARLALADARTKKIRVFRAGKGFVYDEDLSQVQDAQQNLTDALYELTEFKFDIALERAEEFVNEFNELLTVDESEFLENWDVLFEEFNDLLDTEFGEALKKAEQFAKDFKEQTSNLGDLQDEADAKKLLEDTITSLQKELTMYEEGSDEYKKIQSVLKNLYNEYNSLYGKPENKPSGDTESKGYNWKEDIGASYIPGYNKEGEWSGGELAKDLLIPGYKIFKWLGKAFGFAKGTKNFPGGVGLVGEEGPELVELPMGSRIYPTSQTSRMLNNLTTSGGAGNSVNVGTVIINEPNNFDGFVNEFCSQLNLPKPVKFTP